MPSRPSGRPVSIHQIDKCEQDRPTVGSKERQAMDETHMMLILMGLAAGLLIAIVALVAIGGRSTPPVIVQTPPPSTDSGCGGILISVAILFMALIFMSIVMS
jgi:hypothetical protein